MIAQIMNKKMISKRAEITSQDDKGRYILKFSFPEKAEKFDLKKAECSSRYLAYNAKASADEYFKLIKKNFNIKRLELERPKFEIFVSLCGLTCELYLKSFLYYLQSKDDITYIKGHKIYSDLYNKLSQNSKEKIKMEINKKLPDESFEKEFSKLDTIFEDYRYSYELNGFTLNTPFLLELLKTLSKIDFSQL